MTDHVEIIAAGMEACGVNAVVLPDPDERDLQYADGVTAGTECLPYRVTLGSFMRFYREGGADTENAEGFMAGSFGPCRLGKYALEQMKALEDAGINLPIRTTVSNNAYHDLNLDPDFERIVWRGVVAMDILEKYLWRTRPYELEAGSTDAVFEEYVGRLADRIRGKNPFDDVVHQASYDFNSLIDPDLPRRPKVGINGEIFLRSNRFSNNDLVRACETAGLEVVVSPMAEWLKYIAHRNLEDALRDRSLKKVVKGYIRNFIQDRAERAISANGNGLCDLKEPSTEHILGFSKRYLSPACGSEAVLSLGVGIEWMESPEFAGVISVMPHGCMPGGIVAAMADKFSAKYQKPWISLTYDGIMENANGARINDFAEVIRFSSRQAETVSS